MPAPKVKKPLDKHVTILVTEDEREALKKKADKAERSVSFIGRKLLLGWLKEKA